MISSYKSQSNDGTHIMDDKNISPFIPTISVNLADSALYRRRKSHDAIENLRDTFNFDDHNVETYNSGQKVQHGYKQYEFVSF